MNAVDQRRRGKLAQTFRMLVRCCDRRFGMGQVRTVGGAEQQNVARHADAPGLQACECHDGQLVVLHQYGVDLICPLRSLHGTLRPFN